MSAAAIIEKLWAPEEEESSVYAILDGARDPEIVLTIRDRGRRAACLYSGPLSDQLERAAPWLILLDRESPFTHRLLESCWGESWGIFAVVSGTATFPQVRKHFRRFLRVQDHEGKLMLFRYYDPRVFRLYLPTCNEDESEFVFGPVSRFLMEAENPKVGLAFRRTDTSVDQMTFSVMEVPA